MKGIYSTRKSVTKQRIANIDIKFIQFRYALKIIFHSVPVVRNSSILKGGAWIEHKGIVMENQPRLKNVLGKNAVCNNEKLYMYC